MTVAPVLRATHVHRSPQDAFALFTERIGAWWPLRSHGMFGAGSGGLEFRDGRLVERSVTGDESVWGEVVVWEPPTRLVITWHPGNGDGPASEVEVTFVGDDDGTRVELVHRGWESFGDADRIARRDGYVGPSTWGAVLDHYTDIADKLGARTDTSGLRAAYAAFFAEASLGGFAAPPHGEWTAEQIVVHVAINDDGLGAVCRGLIEGAAVTYENAAATDAAVLAPLVAGRSLADLIEIGRDRSAQVVTLLERLDEQQLATEVPCLLRDNGTVVFDRPVPWNMLLLEIQPGRHLAGHTEQLRSLRP